MVWDGRFGHSKGHRILRLSHCGCPWGGRLIKVDLEDVRIETLTNYRGAYWLVPTLRSISSSGQIVDSIHGIHNKLWTAVRFSGLQTEP